MFVRIESSSAVPIYRQIVDQIKYQIATGTLKPGRQMPSVRDLAGKLAVNQNTILKVYNQLRQEHLLEVDRGSGTFVAAGAQTLRAAERKEIVSKILGEAVVQAVHLDVSVDQLHELLDKQYEAIDKQRLQGEKRGTQ
jgi:GntR family transcriptional regulator